jgi:hypothetical protein
VPLTEQGNPDDVLVMKKRFFVTDSELDRNSLVQLHLAYVQGREGIVSGMHPTTKEEATLFAALQAQVEFGIFNPHTHKPGFLELHRYLPPQYHKSKEKDIETLVLQQWKSLGSMTLIDAMFRYHQLCMTLRTHGTTLYAVTVNTALKGKKPVLVPIRLGFTATHIQKMSNDCKAIVKQHTYDHLRKWQYSDLDLTLDFGEFDEAPWVVNTTFGEEIASLIAGYIDILVRINKQAVPDEAEGGVTAELQSVGVAKGRAAVGMTVSTASGGAAGANMQRIADIHDLASFKQAFSTFSVPTLRELQADASKTSLTYEQLGKQLASHTATIERIAREMENAARAHDAQKLADLSKAMALAVTTLLQDAQAAAAISRDEAQQQRLLEASKAILTALGRFTDALIAYEANPCAATQAALDTAKLALDNAMLAVMAAMRGVPADDATGSILLELARNVLCAMDGLCRTAVTDAGKETVQTSTDGAAVASQ